MTVVLVHSPVTVPLKLCHVAALNPMKTGAAAAAAMVKHIPVVRDTTTRIYHRRRTMK